ncbi:hypothetical protein D7V97_14185, partial [Corallococcus sp. CA053C]|uniref:MG2 domain-containing protein n=1 Tax=Corallococcus sp. CA053C TaxID=2316732 RepID=UPI000EC301A4
MFELPRLRALAVVLCLLSLMGVPASARAQTKSPPSWKALDALVADGKVEEAARGVEARLTAAKAKRDADEWTRALVRTVQLRTQLHGYETAVRFLREQPWPDDARQRATLNLFYAAVLTHYVDAYGYEIGRREQVVSQGPVDLKAWTKDQLLAEVQRAHAAVWALRQDLGSQPVTALSEYLQANTYPQGIRSTLRDAVTYLWVGVLARSDLWKPEHELEVFRLDVGTLLEGSPKVELTDGAVHPLTKVAALLGDLEAWHLGAGRREAALEARLRRYEVLASSFPEAADRLRVREHLAAHLKGFRDVAWWAMGQRQLADLESGAGHPVTAHALAKAGAEAWPKSLGGQRCGALVAQLEAPELYALGMEADGPGKRSIQVRHRNLPRVFFRAFALDVEARLAKPTQELSLLPHGEEVRRMLDTRKPDAAWSTALPATPDFREHTTYVTPPALAPGMYAIVVSGREDFREKDNKIISLPVAVTPWVVVARRDGSRRVEVRVVDGATGAAVPDVELRLITPDYSKRRFGIVTRRVDARGEFSLEAEPGTYQSVMLVLGRGRSLMVHPGQYFLSPEHRSTPEDQSLVYTDRAVYRPQQKLLWKVVSFRPEQDSKRYQVLPDAAVKVTLVDPNGQVVETRDARTNSFGSVAGEFTIPAGRPLGSWYVRANPWGAAAVRVEEYKRPTFEVTLKDAPEALRLNRPATFKGEARYYFGLPVTAGKVKWRVSREPVLPPWWYWERPSSRSRLVASGSASLGEDGGFSVTFTPEADERMAKTPGLSWRYRVEADLTDEGGETRSASRAFRLGFVAVEGRVESDAGFFREDQPAQVRLLRSNLDGAPQAGPGRWRLVALKQPASPLLPAEVPVREVLPLEGTERRESTPTPGDALHPRWATAREMADTLESWEDGAELAQAPVTHDAQGVAPVTLPALRAGAYRLRYETTDAFGQKASAQYEFVVAGARAPVALPAMLLAERSSVRVGEVARLVVTSGFEGQPLVLELYQGRQRIEQRVLKAGQGRAVVEIPVTEALRGGFTASLSMVRDWQHVGITQTLSVPFDDKALSLEFATFRDTLRPGAKETFRVTVKGPRGAKLEAGAAELLAYMYDQSLDLFGPHTPPQVAQLYPQQSSVPQTESSASGYCRDWISDDLREVQDVPEPREDQLKFDDGYGLG